MEIILLINIFILQSARCFESSNHAATEKRSGIIVSADERNSRKIVFLIEND